MRGEPASSPKPALTLRNLTLALKHPSLIAGFLTGATSVDLGQRFVSLKVAQLEKGFHDRFQRVKTPSMERLSELASSLQHTLSVSGVHVEPAPPILYVLLRFVKPTVVLETGVHFGVSSSFILHALMRNASGSLTSIDLPEAEYAAPESTYLPGRFVHDALPPGMSTGCLVESRLRERWTVHIGRTREILRPVLEGLETVDVFFRDSEHTYHTMKFEFETAWNFLRPGGFLVSDNVDRNDSFRHFCSAHQVEPIEIRYVGLCQKPALVRAPGGGPGNVNPIEYNK